MQRNLISALWSDPEVDWIAKDYFGRSGGTLILWKKYFIQPIFSFKGEGFIDINFNYKGMHIYLVNVYSSCLILKKRRLWRKPVELKSSWPVGEWKWNNEVFRILDLEVDKAISTLNEMVILEEEGKVVNASIFSKVFPEVNSNLAKFRRPDLYGLEFKILSLEERLSLETPFEDEEVKDIVWQSANDKIPSPDSFNMNFFKACWDILKGVEVGINPRKITAWTKTVGKIQSRLATWKWRASKLIIQKIIKIKSSFLCGEMKIKENKWLWRITNNSFAIQKDLLTFRYGDFLSLIFKQSIYLWKKKESNWWMDLMGLRITPPYFYNWFAHNVWCKLGNGKSIGFWNFIWIGNKSFSSTLPLIFIIVANRNAKIADVGFWVWKTTLGKYSLNAAESSKLMELYQYLLHVSPSSTSKDNFIWLSFSGGFLVKNV
ncbi:hypothetical protein KIW84_022205 [Lathyrus oleraceus]|uniref:Uncharacterized protein n=1 Tax=Pisum sativum TaxID=3888 RepID=A0A9D4YAL3_PEA|nr:hypothetical protein KIW84_022205 [Pisum sativum]